MSGLLKKRKLLLFCVALVFVFLIANRHLTVDASTEKHVRSQEQLLSDYQKKINESSNLCMDPKEELSILDQLTQFEIGRALLSNGDIVAHWNSSIVSRSNSSFEHPMEEWLVNKLPRIKAAKEYSDSLRSQLQKYIKINTQMASVPSGDMHDLLNLNLDGVFNVHMVGIDDNKTNLKFAQDSYKRSNNFSAEFILSKNINELKDRDKKGNFDLIVSNSHDLSDLSSEKLEKLYKNFHDSLHDEGILITSFLTPPPSVSKKSTWKNYDKKDTLVQDVIFNDILASKKQFFQTEDDVRDLLNKSGFKIVEVIYDSQAMLPIVVAKKSSKRN